MINTKRTLLLVGGALVLACFLYKAQQRDALHGEKAAAMHNSIAVIPFQTSTGGWGYDVSVGNKVFIHQPVIPAVPGKVPFRTREDALRVGRLVAGKLRSRKMPAVSVAELQQLGIAFAP